MMPQAYGQSYDALAVRADFNKSHNVQQNVGDFTLPAIWLNNK